MKIKLNFENSVLLLVIMIGIFISIFQILYNRSLWLDESYLALNIMNRSNFQLLQTLDYCQVAPILFLQIEKIFSSLMGNSEFVFRLFPLVCYWGSIYFVYKILKILQLNLIVIILTLSLYVFNGTIIYYSSEVKQYMIDVLVITCMFYAILKSYKSVKNKYYLLGVLGIIGILLSNVSPIILLCCGLYMLYIDFKGERKEIKQIIIVSLIWFVFFIIYYLLFIYNHPTTEFMLWYWSSVGAFMPTNLFDISFYQFLVRKYYIFYHDLFDFGWIGFYSLQMLFLLGCYNLIEKRKLSILILSLAPIIVHLVLSSLKLYPFDLRLILYTCPAMLIIFSFGLEFAYNYITSLDRSIVRILSVPAIILFLLFNVYSKLPLEKSELKKCLTYLKENMDDKEKLYISYYSGFAFKYYNETSRIGFTNDSINMGKIGNYETFMEEVNALDGKVWFVFSDFIDINFKLLMKEQFDDKRHLLIKEFKTTGASVLYYDIKPK